MAQIRTIKKKRRFALENFTALLLGVSVIIYLACSLFVKTYSNTLSTQKQAIENQITTLQTQNDALESDIRTLTAKDRVDSIAASDGLALQQDNITAIGGTDTAETGAQ